MAFTVEPTFDALTGRSLYWLKKGGKRQVAFASKEKAEAIAKKRNEERHELQR